MWIGAMRNGSKIGYQEVYRNRIQTVSVSIQNGLNGRPKRRLDEPDSEDRDSIETPY